MRQEGDDTKSAGTVSDTTMTDCKQRRSILQTDPLTNHLEQPLGHATTATEHNAAIQLAAHTMCDAKFCKT